LTGTITAEEAGLREWLLADPAVTIRRQFGWDVALAGRRVFVVLSERGPGVKLPHARRAALVAQHMVEPLAYLDGKPLSEWVLIVDPDPAVVRALVGESREFVAQTPPSRRRRRG
jgi:hypothetical protein